MLYVVCVYIGIVITLFIAYPEQKEKYHRKHPKHPLNQPEQLDPHVCDREIQEILEQIEHKENQ